jgi:Raf kinase inhibitor-like YbhB/YbcL family protein
MIPVAGILIISRAPYRLMRLRWFGFTVLLVCLFLLMAGCVSSSPLSGPLPSSSPAAPAPSSGTVGGLSLHVASLVPGSALPDRYTCKGSSESPAVSWDGIPDGTKSLVLIFEDPDASSGKFTHWIVFNIPPAPGGLDQAQPNVKVLSDGAQQGDTSAGSRGYYPPCPPIGSTHRYIFRLYAVDMDITQPTADRDSIDWALTGHTVAGTEFVTTFRR